MTWGCGSWRSHESSEEEEEDGRDQADHEETRLIASARRIAARRVPKGG